MHEREACRIARDKTCRDVVCNGHDIGTHDTESEITGNCHEV